MSYPVCRLAVACAIFAEWENSMGPPSPAAVLRVTPDGSELLPLLSSIAFAPRSASAPATNKRPNSISRSFTEKRLYGTCTARNDDDDKDRERREEEHKVQTRRRAG